MIDAQAPRPSGAAWAIAAMIMSAACWGLATVMTKGAVSTVPPFLLLAVQLGSSIAFLWVAVILRRQPVSFDAGTRRLVLSGVLEPGLAYGVGIPGLALTSAAAASVIGASEPAIVMALAWLFLREKLSMRLFAAIAVAMAGVALITATGKGSGTDVTLLGNLLVLGGTAFAALYVVVSRSLVSTVSPLTLAALQQSVGFLFSLLLLTGTWVLGHERAEAAIPAEIWLLAIVSGVVQYALAFWFYLIGLKVLPAGTAAAFLTLIPVFGVGGAMIFLGETQTALQWLGCVLVVAAIGAATLSGRGKATMIPTEVKMRHVAAPKNGGDWESHDQR